MFIDISEINLDDFYIDLRGDKYLVNPKKSKHVWAENELKYRSLLLSKNGQVLSSGFPKFRNYGEDEAEGESFRAALKKGLVRFYRKEDGTLIVADRINGNPHFRTRGSDVLGLFEEPVMDLINSKYPKLLQFMKGGLAEDYSLLFEYVGPENRIVLKYEEPELVFLGAVNKKCLEVDHQYRSLIGDLVERFTGIRSAECLRLPGDFNELMKEVRSWQDSEGVVAAWTCPFKFKPMLLKIKATQYVKLHAMKFRMEGKVAKLCFLLGILKPSDIMEKLEKFGVDYETVEFLKPEFEEYFNAHENFTYEFFTFEKKMAAAIRGRDRKSFVEFVQSWQEKNPIYKDRIWFSAAMKMYEGKTSEAYNMALTKLVLNESYTTVRNWIDNPNVEVEGMLSHPIFEENNG